MKMNRILVCGIGALTAGVLIDASPSGGKPLWEMRPSLWELSAEVSDSQSISATDPQHDGLWSPGGAANLNTENLKISLWGPPHRLTLSVNKTDVWDRRRYQEPPLTLRTLKDLMLSDRAPAERYPNYYQSNHAYDSPCPKPIGQVILGLDDFEGVEGVTAVTETRDGVTRVHLESGDRRAEITYLPMMTRNLVAVRGVFRNLAHPVSFRLYRHRDTIEPGKAYIAYGSPEQRIRYGYNYGKDSGNGPIDPPSSGSDGEVFWIEQELPPDKTFPGGFRYALAGLVVGAETSLSSVDGERDLGTKPYLNESQRKHIEANAGMENLMPVYDRIREATGSASTATMHPGKHSTEEATWLISVVTSNEAADPLAEAERRLLEAASIGMDGLRNENASYFRALYERRENGRIFTEGSRKDEQDHVLEAFRSWTDQHERNTSPDPTRYEADAKYGYLEQDWAPWHGLPCYNELYFTSAQVRNRGDRMSYYYKLVPFWMSAARANAWEVFDLPGALIQHGYLPPVKPNTYAHTHSTWEFCMEIPAQVLKVLWDRFDYGGDETFLADVAYPAIRELAIFYSHYAALGEDGYFHIIPTVSAEYWNWRSQFDKNRDSASALGMFRWLLGKAADASELLSRDADLRGHWREVAARMAPYPIFESDEGPIYTDVRDANPIGEGYNFFAGFTLTTLADEVNLDSSPEDREMMLRTTRLVNGWHEDTVLELLGESKGLNPEQLLNSRSGRIHLFPAVPDGATIGFRDFQARGGFLVSAQYDRGTIDHVTVEARRNVTCRMMNPWPGSPVRMERADTGEEVKTTLDNSNGECLMFAAEAGVQYRVILESRRS